MEALATDPNEPLSDPFRVFKEATLEQLEDFASGHLRDLLLKLTDDQILHVRRPFTGAMLLKGVAGSGKTTVGLHRALQLSQAGRCVLFLTFNPVLKAITQSLMAGVVEPLPSTLQVMDYRTWVLGQAASAGQGATPISRAEALQIMEDVLPTVRATNASAVLKRPASFFVDEVERVIKGFGLTGLDDYLTTPRYGRKTALSALARTAVWQVVDAYNARLRAAGHLDGATSLCTCTITYSAAPPTQLMTSSSMKRRISPPLTYEPCSASHADQGVNTKACWCWETQPKPSTPEASHGSKWDSTFGAARSPYTLTTATPAKSFTLLVNWSAATPTSKNTANCCL